MMKEFEGSQNYKNEPQELFLMLHFSHPQQGDQPVNREKPFVYDC